jgi:Flp pilus assembly protein CpaB
VPRARRVARPGWLNLRTVAGLLLFTAAIIGGGRFLEAARTTSPAWAATRDIPRGAPVTAADLRLVEVQLPGDLAAGYLSGREAPEGLIATESIRAGTLIATDSVDASAEVGPGRAITVPVAPEHAVGGALRPGDLVDVFATTSEGGAAACTRLVAPGVEVLEAVAAGGIVLEGETLAGITLSVTPEQAAALAHAIRTSEIDVAVHQGRVAEPPPGRICAEDLR